MVFNFGATPFVHPLPSGYVAVDSAPPAWRVAGGSVAPAEAEHAPACLILEPTRELAEQVVEQINAFGKYLPEPQLRTLLLTGGSNAKEQAARLRRGVDIVVATAGRAKEMLKNGALSLASTRFFVMDEADDLLSAGDTAAFIRSVYAALPLTRLRVQIMCFSATLHTPVIRTLAAELMQHPTWVDLKGHDLLPATVHHAAVRIDPRVLRVDKSRPVFKADRVHKKDRVRVGGPTDADASHTIKLLKVQILVDLIDTYAMDQAIVFCRTRLDCDTVAAYLNSLPVVAGGQASGVSKYAALALHSGMNAKRAANLEAFKAGSIRFLVCTDVAARGIDISGLPFVINYTLPDEAAQYVHRVGRVGRADTLGLAISLVASTKERVWFHTCSSRSGKCSNTALVSDGGCTIWYDEPALLGAIEDLIAEEIQFMDAQYRLPHLDAAPGSIKYGEKVDVVEAPSSSAKYIDALKPTVKTLAQLEHNAQVSFLTMGAEFEGVALA